MQIVKELVPTANPLKVLTDFELAAINAFREEFPEAELSVLFSSITVHCEKSWRTWPQKPFREGSKFVKSLAALSFVPIEYVNEVFARLAEQFPQNEAYKDLLAYFEANYIRGQQIGNQIRNPRFPPYPSDALGCAPKTTNCCERFHNALQGMFQVRHPTVWHFFEGLQKDMGLTQT